MCEGTSAVMALWRQGGVSCHCGVSCQGAPTQLNISLKSSKNVTTVISWTHVELEVSVYYLHVFFIRCPSVPMEVGGGRGGRLDWLCLCDGCRCSKSIWSGSRQAQLLGPAGTAPSATCAAAVVVVRADLTLHIRGHMRPPSNEQ